MKEKQKEVKKSTQGKNFYLFIFQQIKDGKNPKQIREEFNISKQAMNYYLSSLKKQNLIQKIGYGVWETSKNSTEEQVKKSIHVAKITPHNIFTCLKQDSVRGHAFQFKLKLPTNMRNWDKREEIFSEIGYPFKRLKIFGGGQAIEFKGRKIHLTDKSIIIYEKESFISETAQESQSQAINHFIGIIRQLERELKANFSFGGKYRFRVSRQHYSLIKNALAKQYNDHGEKLEVYNDSGLWFLIDNSFNLNEAETVHAKTGVNDNKKVQDFFNGLKEEPITPQEIKANHQELIDLIHDGSELQIGQQQVMSQIENNLLRLTKIVYEIGSKK